MTGKENLTDELVSRLRNYAPYFFQGKPLVPKVCRDAADIIEALEADKAVLREALKGMVAFGEEVERKHLVGDEGCFWPVEIARTALSGELG